MEPQKITEIFIKSTMYNPNSVSKQPTKHRLDDYDEHNVFEHDYEFPIHKVQKIDDSELLEALAQVQSGLDKFKAIDFDVESFIKNLTTKTTIPMDESASAYALLQVPTITSATSIKNNKTLAELIHICYEPIEEDKIVEKEIQEIVHTLKYKSKSFQQESILIAKLKMLFNSLVFKTYDFSKDGFNPKSATVLYEALYKVNVHIRHTETMEYKIYFGFPFYLSIRINMLGKIFIARNNIYKKIATCEAIDKIHYYSSNTGFNILDLVTTSKYIALITSKNFVSGFDLVSKLTHILDIYKINSDKLKFNKLKINFERFAKLYKKAINIVSEIPIRDL